MITKQWLAGFFDGEGTVHLGFRKPNKQSRMTNPSYYLRISIAQKDKNILDEVQRFLGYGKVYLKAQGRCCYYECSCLLAQKFLIEMSPYLQCKKLQAKIALRFMKYVKKPPHVRGRYGRGVFGPLSKKQIRWREKYRQLINKRMGRGTR